MGKILIWTPIPVQRKASAEEILAENLIGTNSGNLLFVTSVVRTLMTGDDVRFETVFGKPEELTDESIERYNAECDCFAIPLANAFRVSYMDHLRRLTQLVKRLRIPCVVIGVGLQMAMHQQVGAGYRFDEDVRAFVRAVLEKSAVIGLRGRQTGEYLKSLGFVEERDYTVIGCPSMYFTGAKLPEIRRTTLSAGARICVNGKLDSSKLIHDWMATNCKLLPDYRYVPQRIEEFWMMGYGIPIFRRQNTPQPGYIPVNRRSPLIRERRSVGFLNAYTWVEFMREADFVYGCNIHGNIAALLAGTPCVTVVKDRRVAEIAEFFEIPRVGDTDMKAGRSVVDLYEHADYGPMQRNHPGRFVHFVDFLNRNGLEHIYAAGSSGEEAPYDRYVRENGALSAYYPAETAELFNPGRMLPMGWKVLNNYGNRIRTKVRKSILGR